MREVRIPDENQV